MIKALTVSTKDVEENEELIIRTTVDPAIVVVQVGESRAPINISEIRLMLAEIDSFHKLS